MIARQPLNAMLDHLAQRMHEEFLRSENLRIAIERFAGPRVALLLERRQKIPSAQLAGKDGDHRIQPPLAGQTIVYMLRHKSRAAATESWAKFTADPEWVALKAESEKDGAFVKLHESTFLKLTDFSPKV